MTIKNTIEFFYENYDPMEDHFEKSFPSFHNLLWQLIVNDAHKDKIICLHPVYHGNVGLQISIVFWDERGHQATNVKFRTGTTYDQAQVICDKLNEQLFGIMPSLSFMIVARSMRKPEEAAVDQEETIDND